MRFFGRAPVYIILFTSLVFTALQNVTVDDAVLTGTVVPDYLPSQADWHQGNNCSTCNVQLDPSMVYNGTWHDTTYYPTSSITQAFEFTFTGSALYIFFVLANYVPDTTTFTHVEFVLDGTLASSFTHNASTSTSFEYNQTVYANSSIPYGQHTMLVMPVNDTTDIVLMLFDYLVYTTNTSSESPTTTGVTSSPTSTSQGAPTMSSKLNVSAVVGGTVAGVVIILLLITSLLYYRRYKRRAGESSRSTETAAVEPFILPHTAPTPLVIESGSRSKDRASPAVVPSSILPSTASGLASSTTAATVSSDLRSHGTTEILEQVEQLRDEVARLRTIQDQSWSASGLELQPPPEYS